MPLDIVLELFDIFEDEELLLELSIFFIGLLNLTLFNGD